MTLITRQGKGSKLTIQEMDGNLTYLESLAQEGGDGIIVEGDDEGSTVRTGNSNIISGPFSTIIGGQNNTIISVADIIDDVYNLTYNGSSLDGNYYDISPTSTSSGLGTGATFYFFFSEGNLVSSSVENIGLNYVNGDTLTFDGTLFGGVSGVDNVTLQIVVVNPNSHSTIGGGYFNIINNGDVISPTTNTYTGSTLNGTFENVSPSSTLSGLGTGATFNIIFIEGTLDDIIIVNGGSGYVNDDILTFDGTLFGGVSGVDNVTSRIGVSYSPYSTIGGGCRNTANGNCSTISGGNCNIANGSRSTIGGGRNNIANGSCSTIGGGCGNRTNASHSTIAGGDENTAGLRNVIQEIYNLTYTGSTLNGTFENISPSSTLSGLGSGATFNVEFFEGNLQNVFLVNGGSNYVGGDTLTFDGVLFGGESGVDDITLRIDTFSIGTHSTIGGGCRNTSSGCCSTIGGGYCNTASGRYFDLYGNVFGVSTVGGGAYNTASGNCSTISGGKCNTASGCSSTIGGGGSNISSGCFSTVGGGRYNTASAGQSTIGGGNFNTASCYYSTIGGGRDNVACNNYSTVGGGRNNTSIGKESTIGGGVSNTSSGNYSTIGGGRYNTVNTYSSTIGGGVNNSVGIVGVISNYYDEIYSGNILDDNFSNISPSSTSSGLGNGATFNFSFDGGLDNISIELGGSNYVNNDTLTFDGTLFGGESGVDDVTLLIETETYGSNSTIGGGGHNCASANNSTIGGGVSNTSSGNYSTIGGGVLNTSSGGYSTIGGGKQNAVSCRYSTIGGGRFNTSTGDYSIMGGGRFNTASGYISTIGGGRSNMSSGNESTIGGGAANTASGQASIIGGGAGNIASGQASIIGGGAGNIASCRYSTISGGLFNLSSGYYSTVGGGCNNISSGNHTSILGGTQNNTCTFACAMIVGSNICADRACTTFVNALSVKNMPTSSAGLPSGTIWSDSCTLKIV